MVSAAVASGNQSRTCTHQGGEAPSSSAMARPTIDPPTMKIRKAAGPSPTLKPAKSRPQARHFGAKVARPANRVLLPQRGQSPRGKAAWRNGAQGAVTSRIK